MKKRLIVIGAGISGLAAARTAADWCGEHNCAVEVLVLERNNQVGGKAQSLRENGWLIEAGPTGYLDSEPVVDELATAAGIISERIQAQEAAANRFVVRGGYMRHIPLHPLRFARTGILGPGGLCRLLLEPFIPKKRSDEDETVWQFAHRRLGKQVADRLIAPMVIGVFAGDAKRLSLPAAFPRIAALEYEHGSLIRGMIHRRRKGKDGGPGGPAGILTSFKEGLQTLPRALAQSQTFTVRCGVMVKQVYPNTNNSWLVQVEENDRPIPADAVVLAGEAWSMRQLIKHHAPDLAQPLGEIPYPQVNVVALGFGRQGLDRIPPGFGVLIPRGEGYRILGVLWDSYIFPGREPDNHLLLRVMLGGTVDKKIDELDEEATIRLVRAEIARLFHLTVEPVYTKVIKWTRAIPQYELGHLSRVTAVEKALTKRPGLYIAGNALYGVAFGKAAAAGVQAGKAAAKQLCRK